NWDQKTLTITATKQRSARVCPLISSLADATSRYIREVRPRTEHREIFLRMYAPRRPFRHGGLYGIVATRFERLGIKSPRTGPVTLFWHRKHDALSGFWRFAIQRGYTDRSPVPVRRPKKPIPFIPYIYTREELRRLLDGVTSYQKRWCKLEPGTLRTLLLVLYGAGLRTSEPIRIACFDVDLVNT